MEGDIEKSGEIFRPQMVLESSLSAGPWCRRAFWTFLNFLRCKAPIGSHIDNVVAIKPIKINIGPSLVNDGSSRLMPCPKINAINPIKEYENGNSVSFSKFCVNSPTFWYCKKHTQKHFLSDASLNFSSY